jgi:Oxaloacetate decarboxylase, gamma chain.
MNLLGISNLILLAASGNGSLGTVITSHLNGDFALGAVFAGIIFVCVIIYLSKKDAPGGVPAVDNSKEMVQDANTAELMNDSELVAVITAAIMASMGDEAPADGLYIRSIKRSSGNRWKNA